MERYTNPDCKPEMEELMKDCPRSRSGAECWLRLRDIEDILGDEYDLDRLRELVEADRDGRCEIHMVKDGERVYSIFAYVNGLCPKKPDGKPFDTIAEYTVNDFTRNTVDREFGKTVFLTRESAEAALKGEQNGD